METGLRVVRGPDWKYSDQDGGEGHVGTVVAIGGHIGSDVPAKCVVVIWDNGVRKSYRAGRENSYDLYAFDNGQCGVIHASTTCDGCQEEEIKGFRWKCDVCEDFDLCTSCYMSDKHDISHPFSRLDKSTSEGVRLPSRSSCVNEKRSALGIFNDAVVCRGPDWCWGDQDGENGKTGRVESITKWKESFRGLISVKWNSGVKNNYRLGPSGKVDLKCVEPASGGNYFKSHLPVVSKIEEDTTDDEVANFLPSLFRAAMGTMLLAPLVHMMGAELSELMNSETSIYGVGFRVVRGPDWEWENQDGGEGYLGTITEIGGPGLTQPMINSVSVVWDNGSKNLYRAGLEDKFDLRVFDIGANGARHDSIKCDGCEVGVIKGIRWNCFNCKIVNLCTECYSNDKHDVNHQFLRYDIVDPKKVFKVPKRSESQKVQTMGIFPGASVCRGRDWKWGGQDGGEGNIGRVLTIEDDKDCSVSVQWPSGSKNSYRLGNDGKIDLKCSKATSGGFYYRNHMPIFGKLEQPEKTARFKVGDTVKCSVQAPQLRNLQIGHGGFSAGMIPLINIPGSVKSIDDDGDVVVVYPNGKQLIYNPDALAKE